MCRDVQLEKPLVKRSGPVAAPPCFALTLTCLLSPHPHPKQNVTQTNTLPLIPNHTITKGVRKQLTPVLLNLLSLNKI